MLTRAGVQVVVVCGRLCSIFTHTHGKHRPKASAAPTRAGVQVVVVSRQARLAQLRRLLGGQHAQRGAHLHAQPADAPAGGERWVCWGLQGQLGVLACIVSMPNCRHAIRQVAPLAFMQQAQAFAGATPSLLPAAQRPMQAAHKPRLRCVDVLLTRPSPARAPTGPCRPVGSSFCGQRAPVGNAGQAWMDAAVAS